MAVIYTSIHRFGSTCQALAGSHHRGLRPRHAPEWAIAFAKPEAVRMRKRFRENGSVAVVSARSRPPRGGGRLCSRNPWRRFPTGFAKGKRPALGGCGCSAGVPPRRGAHNQGGCVRENAACSNRGLRRRAGFWEETQLGGFRERESTARVGFAKGRSAAGWVSRKGEWSLTPTWQTATGEPGYGRGWQARVSRAVRGGGNMLRCRVCGGCG